MSPERVAAGWRAGPGPRVGAAVLAGVALSLAFPGPDLGPVALIALVPLLLAVEDLRPRQAAALGYLTGVVFVGLLIWWIPTEFLSWTGVAGWLAWVALCVAEACFVAAFAALVPASRRLGPWRVLLLPACLATLELLRAHGPIGGFPWGILGVSQHGGGPLLPLARVVGAYGLSAIIVAVNFAVASWIRALARRRLTGQVVVWPLLAVVLALSGLLAPGPPAPGGAPLRLAVIQAGLLGGHGLDRGAATEAVFANHVRRTEALAGQPRPDLVIWGEGAVDQDPLTTPDRLERIRQAAAAAGAPLLVGATTSVGDNRYATDALLFTDSGALADRYRKRRLVPFGEYVPMASLMGRILPVTREGVPFDKVPGDRLEPMTVGDVRIGTIICWESAYAEDPRTLAREGAQIIVVATNNASFGEGPASRQHLASSQLRAVEEGRTLVQAAVSGSSAIIGPDGVARQETGLYQQTTIRAAVAPRSGLTLYARFGQAIEATLVALAVVTLVVALLPWSRRRVVTAPTAVAPGPGPAIQAGSRPRSKDAGAGHGGARR
jgi:apolipoprotein N-acyltransferase